MPESINKKVEDTIEEETKEKDKDEWVDLALRDNLTGLYNRNAYDIIIDDLKDDIKYLFIVDIDHFKNINDEYGHLVGDDALVELANLLSEKFLVSRWGGEEFVGLLIEDSPEEALEQIREEIENTKFTDKDLNITVTIGYTDFDKSKDTDLIFQEADSALYCGKESGRNIVLEYENDMEDVCPAHIKDENGELIKNKECETCDETEKDVEGKKEIESSHLITMAEAQAMHGEHCIKLHCVKCDDIITCRCKQPKVEMDGICGLCEIKARKHEIKAEKVVDEQKLYMWALEQAYLYREGQLEDWQIQQLKSVNFPFDYYVKELEQVEMQMGLSDYRKVDDMSEFEDIPKGKSFLPMIMNKKVESGKIYINAVNNEICIDFDGTLYDGENLIAENVEILKQLKEDGYKLTIFTARGKADQKKAEKILKEGEVPYGKITNTKPQTATAFLDDRAINVPYNGKWGKGIIKKIDKIIKDHKK